MVFFNTGVIYEGDFMIEVDELKTGTEGDGLETGSSRVSFTPEQQSRMQVYIDNAYKRGLTKGSGANDEVKRLSSEVENLKDYKVNSAILEAVSRHNVVDAAEVSELIRRNVRVGESGEVRAVESGSFGREDSDTASVGLSEYVERWLEERPHHLRGQGASGGGSGSARFGNGVRRYDLSNPDTWRKIPREDLDQLLKEGINIQSGSGQIFSFKDVTNPFHEARKRRFVNSGG